MTGEVVAQRFPIFASVVQIGLAICIADPANASTGGPGVISGYDTNSAGMVYFYLSGTRTSTPSCHVIAQRWAFNASTAGGQALAATVLSAYSQQKSVVVVGTGSCDIYADTESVQQVQIQN